MTVVDPGSRCLFVVWFAAVAFCVANRSDARVGETSLQFVDRYGPPKDTPSSKSMDNNSPLIEGAIHHTYQYKGWKIRAAFLQLDGPAVRMDYSKLGVNPQIPDYELQAIFAANTPAGMTWTRMAFDNLDSPNKSFAKTAEPFVSVGERMWRRTDGAILWSRGDLMLIRLELPAAREYEEQLKIRKEQQARASVPQF